MDIKLSKAKSNWVKYMCDYYFEEEDDGFLEGKNEREEFFLSNIKRALKLNEKDFINYLISEGWTASISEAYITYFDKEVA